ncbi:11627_t:CDS:2 [Acaulospora colombiana]|uniref:11627_t:CDS:1 n=1 Tax=Acaulospora colombiana TaxID=27376 RepID=A0ACA9KIE0_9GLOM|nr:11627_t:CDS:2 [Acaulospora colombiana]
MDLQPNAEIESETHDLAWYISNIKKLLTSSSVEVKGESSEDARLQYAIKHYREACEIFPNSYDLKVHAAQLAIQCEDQNHPASEYNASRRLFVEDILTVLLRKKIVVHETHIPPDIRVYEPQDYLSVPYATSTQVKYPANVNVTYSQLKLWLERAQGYYIASKEWRKLFEISLTVMDSTGYLVFPRYIIAHLLESDNHKLFITISYRHHSLSSSPRITIADFFEDPSQLPAKLFNLLNQTSVNQTSLTSETILNSFCLSIGVACFVYCCYEFYDIVSGLKHVSSPESTSNCIIPIWTEGINAEFPNPLSPPNYFNLSNGPRASKKRRISFLLTGDPGRNNLGTDGDDGESEYSITHKRNHRSKNVMNVRNLLIDDDDEIGEMEGSRIKEWQEPIVRNAISHLERASKCWDDLRSMVNRRGNELEFLNREFGRLLDAWNLPLDVFNAVMLTRADSELINGNINTAYTSYREIISRISAAWGSQRKRESRKEKHSTPVRQDHQRSFNDNTLDPASTCESTIKEQSPLILTFRVLYSISTLYRAIGWWAQARVELCMILATLPITPVDERCSERDDWYMAKIWEDLISRKSSEFQRFKLIEMTKEGLVIRTVKELMACFEYELNSAQDSLLDQTIGNIIVLMQFGWPYWRNQLRQVLFPKIRSRGGLKYPDMLRFLHNVEILGEMLKFHGETPNIEFSFFSNDSFLASTTESIQAMENRISNSPRFNGSKSLAEFFRERLNDEPLNSNSGEITSVEHDAKLKRGNIVKSLDRTATPDARAASKSWKMDVSSIVAIGKTRKSESGVIKEDLKRKMMR